MGGVILKRLEEAGVWHSAGPVEERGKGWDSKGTVKKLLGYTMLLGFRRLGEAFY